MGNKVLVIDDDVEIIDAVTTLLDAKGYQVISAENGKEGCAKANAESPDIILLDVMMTKKTEGFDTARALRDSASTKDIPVIMVTGIRKEMSLPFGFSPDDNFLPVKAVLEKPVKPEVLLKLVEEHIRK
ncbi:MAG: response regulator [Candidatus Omnitrophica bacterium]|nr:response regulator [Candidatus Omnitrophota bacterium]